MKRILSILLIFVSLSAASGCSVPDDMQLDVYLGTTEDLKLLHVNASTQEKQLQIEKIHEAVTDIEAIDKPLDLFAFYPDYTIVVDDLEDETAERITVVLDINRDRLELYRVQNGEISPTLYRSNMSVEEFKSYMNLVKN